MMQTSVLEPKVAPPSKEALKVNPQLINELKQFGVVSPEICYNCGLCVAVCGQSGAEHNFPRRTIRCVQLGLEEELLSSVEPWLCYYCGDCTDSCPREAEPAEMMMGIRRWLIAKYDYTGQAKHYYTSTKRLILDTVFFALLPVLGLFILHYFGWARIVSNEVRINEFAPVMIIWIAAIITGTIHALILLAGGYHMFKLVMNDDALKDEIRISDYLLEIKEFVANFITQKKWLACGKKEATRWLKHLILVLGYATMFILIIGFLWWFQTDNIYPITHPQRWIGYLATIILLFGTIDIIVGRLQKKDQIHRFSHHSDWAFPIILFLVVVTGILVHILRYMALPLPTYIMYTIHLMASNVMLSTEVGVGKWSHLLYRPLAHYLDAVKERAQKRILVPGDPTQI